MGMAGKFVYLSFVKYIFQAIVIILYGQDRCGEMYPFSNLTTPTVSSFTLSPNVTDHSILYSENDNGIPIESLVMKQFGFTDDDLQYAFLALMIHLFAWRILAYLLLLLRARFIRKPQGLCICSFSNLCVPRTEFGRFCRELFKLLMVILSVVGFAVLLMLPVMLAIKSATEGLKK